MRVFLAAVLLGHGIAHLVGFVVPWRLMTSADVPYRTTVLGGFADIGPTGVRMLGVAWLAMVPTFVAVAAGLLLQAPWSQQAALAAVAASTVLCVLGWPDSRVGLMANAFVLALFLVHARVAGVP